MLFGRGAEQAAIGRLLDEARGGRSGVLVLRGEPGIGKTALLEHAAAAAGPEFRVIRATGVEYEAELPFAGLTLLLAPGLDRLPALPGPQRRALEGAFGLAEESGPAGGRLLTGLATLGLLAELASEKPLLCLVDDAQWLDGSSAEALLLAARRLQAEGIVLLLAARDDEGAIPAAGLPELRLAGLDEPAAAELLSAQAGFGAPAAGDDVPADGAGRVPPDVRRRVLAEARGNPLALTELPAALAAEPAGSAGSGRLPLTSRLRLAFHGRVSGLPAATQTLLLVAAAEEAGDLAAVLRAAAALGAGPDALAPAERAGLVRITGPEGAAVLAFRHPLVRAAILHRAPLRQRSAAHRALGEALEDGDRRTWHLALAATAPDAALADALERTAERAEARGGHGAASAAYERAARLTPDRDGATRRLVLAAEAATEEGRLEHAEALAERAGARTDDPFAHAMIAHVRATAHFWRGDHPTAYRLLLDACTPGIEASHAARMLFQAFHAAWYVGEEPVGAVLDRLAALRLPAGEPAAPLVRHLLAGTLPLLGRPAPPLPSARETAAEARRAGAVPSDLVQLCGATLILGRDDETYELAAGLATEARAKGAVGMLPTVQFFLAEAELFHGRHRDAEVTATEALALAEDTGQRQWVSQLASLLAYLAALRGDADSCAALVRRALAGAGPGGAPPAGEPWAQWALALLDLGQGRAADAADRLGPLTTGRHRHHVGATRAVPDLVEAAVRLGTPELAAEPYERFARWAAATGQPWAHALRLRCQALLGPDELAESGYLAALDLHRDSGRPFEQGRTALLYGEWLRRERRRTDARPHLRAALEAFDLLGARPWAERARTELTATGTPAPAGPAAGPLAVLTPQELQIVRLAAQGRSNRDIAAQLFLSPRTVGHHLYKAYPKLGVASRGELADLL
ncbi:LuxR family transcriptional regulator [Kitasatospora herbaricolor]|uniref:ATP-binding protein n=1 Tax=Kitasatospora herbaricolor TaxID=68217 RepID=UPI0017486B83|nr:helix-turn-helix transcriptional regulator [Kitasatospora herbaricolor]MDQ0309285.1 DNA-binding CsgD family transcriptional regulator [Kitasatospora herbaricolor]GGV04164.1 LuxR family transcriptional regulator [Kitasatospora herbaricolor]